MELADIIIEKIRHEGAICFRDFMEYCLYYPELGYYTSPGEKIGAKGDFYTSASLGPVYGAMLGRQLEEMWCLTGKQPFTIVEYGAGTGSLCRDILKYLQGNRELYEELRYCIIEKSGPLCNAGQQRLEGLNVSWHSHISELSGFSGCVLSNELLDNFAVHQVVMKDELMEVHVGYEDRFIETMQPARREIKDYLAELNVQLAPGFRTEINLQAIAWMADIAAAMKKGYVLTIDYGYLSDEFYAQQRCGGTLVCYQKHRVNDQVYEHIGRQDITAHVNFSALSHWGAKLGLDECGYTDQYHFLLGLGVRDYILQLLAGEKDIVAAARKVSMLTHTLLMDMGRKFKVLVQSRNAPGKGLSGLSLV
jgi:SAM-dependent MidA family methyltransferase